MILAWMASLWSRYGKDHPTPTVYPQFDIPNGFSPASLGYLYHSHYRSNFIASTLINLAVKGYISIQEIPKSGVFGRKKFSLEKLKEPDGILPAEEYTLLNELWGNSPVKIIDGKY